MTNINIEGPKLHNAKVIYFRVTTNLLPLKINCLAKYLAWFLFTIPLSCYYWYNNVRSATQCHIFGGQREVSQFCCLKRRVCWSERRGLTSSWSLAAPSAPILAQSVLPAPLYWWMAPEINFRIPPNITNLDLASSMQSRGYPYSSYSAQEFGIIFGVRLKLISMVLSAEFLAAASSLNLEIQSAQPLWNLNEAIPPTVSLRS